MTDQFPDATKMAPAPPSRAMNIPFIRITSDYGWIGRFAWHNSSNWDYHPEHDPLRWWGTITWSGDWGGGEHVSA